MAQPTFPKLKHKESAHPALWSAHAAMKSPMAALDNVIVEVLVTAQLCPQKASGSGVAETEIRLLKKQQKTFFLMLSISQLPRCSLGNS